MPQAPRDSAARADDDDATHPGKQPGRFWDRSPSGFHRVSRPIVIDGLREPKVRIELSPRIKLQGGQLVDDSYHAVESTAVQFVHSLTIEQLVMATVTLRIYMRKSKDHIQKKKELQERWTELARRMKRLRVEDQHLTLDEKRFKERSADAAPEARANPSVTQLHAAEEEELLQRRRAWAEEKVRGQAGWSELERKDEELLRSAPPDVEARDLQQPYVLTLLAGKPTAPRHRSLASAMKTLVEALEGPLSRTDQMLLEIALRRCVRASVPERGDEARAEQWERALLTAAETEFVQEFPWADAFLGLPPRPPAV